MNSDNELKIQQILSELPEDKRKILKDHIDELSGKERDDFLNEVITEYEAIKKRSAVTFTDAAKKISQEIEPAVKDEKLEEAINQSSDISPEPVIKPEDITETPFTDEPVEEEIKDKPAVVPEIKETRESRKPVRVDVSPFVNEPEPRKKKPIAAIIICSVLAVLLVGGGALYALVFSKNVNPAPTETESSAPTETETSALPTPTPEPIPTTDTTPETTPEETEAPTPTPIPLKADAPDLKGIKVVIDPGHQQKTDYKKEPFKKGSKNGKARCTSGTTGVSTKQKEYELTLDTALMLKEYLEKCGATVILTRTENDVNISNKERAELAVKNKPTIFLRLHADAASSAKTKGVRVYIPKSGKLNKTKDADKLGKLVASAAKTTYRGSKATNQYTGLNYASSIRSYQIVLGYLSNTEDDNRLADPENRYEMCAAIAKFCKNFKKK
ncbi:MAG: N-acetylmuramoyl-L-alanine amidase [Clostridiales bacterium]|nr:N-acetylmuramoyl-L-alanine amidase [Clostridiales bacterium]